MTTVITRSSKRKRVLPEGAVSAVILQGFLGSRFAACLTHVSLAALTAAYLAALIYLPFWIAFVPGILCAHRIGILLHEYMHGIPFRRYRDNHAVVTLFDGGLLMFGTLEMFRVSHLQHHRWLNHEPDRTRGKSDTPGQRTADVAAALQLFQYLGKFPAAISGAQPHVRRDRLLVSAILSIVTIWAWTAVGRPDVAWKMVVVTLATMLVPVSLRTAIEHHAAPGHPHFANEYRVWVPLFNLNRHIHHHEDPTIPWYRLQWRTQAPLSRSHYVSHWVHVHLKRDFVLMRPMRASDAAPRAVRPDRPKAVDVTSLQRPIRPSSEFDVAIIGGGINGACLYHALSAGGYRVLLVDRGDFASGTSQASTMMIWGGLLYLKDWELATVCSLSASRDRLIVRRPSQVRPRTIRYVPVAGGRSRVRVQSLLYAYWLLGGTRRPRPRFERDFEERAMLNQDGVAGALTYEEGGLEASDARFVLSWILHGGGPGCRARNYCALESATYDRSRREWRLDLSDTLDGGSGHAGARLVVNAAGGWTDRINAAAGIDSPYRHLLSRGVSIAVPRDPLHTTHLMFDKSVDRSAMAFAPWGPVGLWGSTDTVHADMERAGQADAADLQFLLDELNQHLAKPAGPGDVVSIRCGVRPLAVPRNQPSGRHSASLSRHYRVHADPGLPWISVYGGKLSGCTTLARAVHARVAGELGPVPLSPLRSMQDSLSDAPDAATERFPGLDMPVVTPAWSVAHEKCRTLDDYLRRRTNIAQWVHRGGMGARYENVGHLHSIAVTLHGGDHAKATNDLYDYRARLDREWRLLEGVSL